MTALAPTVTSARRARPRPDARRQGWVRRGPLLPALVFTIIVTQLPFLVTLYYSLESWSLVRPGSQHFVGLTMATMTVPPVMITVLIAVWRNWLSLNTSR